jgi:iron complex transport system substrate-binding protein
VRLPRSSSLRIGAAAAVVVAATGLAACGTTDDAADASSDDKAITITDARGKTVTLDGPAERVAGTEWNVIEYLVSLGVQPVGVSDIKGFKQWDSAVTLDADAKDIGTRGEPSLDTLATLDLDVLFVTDQLVGDALEQIEKSIPVIVVPGGDAKDPTGQMFQNVDLVAKATGTEDEAAKLKKRLDDKLAETKQKVAASDLAGAPVALNDAYAEGSNVSVRPYMPGSQLGALLDEIGLKNAWSSIKGLKGDPVYGLAATDVEGLTKLPDDTQYWYIGNEESTPDVYAETLKDNTVWTSLPFADDAVPFPTKIWMFGGPLSMIQFLEQIDEIVAKA